jgi:hypothetical protein
LFFDCLRPSAFNSHGNIGDFDSLCDGGVFRFADTLGASNTNTACEVRGCEEIGVRTPGGRWFAITLDWGLVRLVVPGPTFFMKFAHYRIHGVDHIASVAGSGTNHITGVAPMMPPGAVRIIASTAGAGGHTCSRSGTALRSLAQQDGFGERKLSWRNGH